MELCTRMPRTETMLPEPVMAMVRGGAGAAGAGDAGCGTVARGARGVGRSRRRRRGGRPGGGPGRGGRLGLLLGTPLAVELGGDARLLLLDLGGQLGVELGQALGLGQAVVEAVLDPGDHGFLLGGGLADLVELGRDRGLLALGGAGCRRSSGLGHLEVVACALELVQDVEGALRACFEERLLQLGLADARRGEGVDDADRRGGPHVGGDRGVLGRLVELGDLALGPLDLLGSGLDGGLGSGGAPLGVDQLGVAGLDVLLEGTQRRLDLLVGGAEHVDVGGDGGLLALDLLALGPGVGLGAGRRNGGADEAGRGGGPPGGGARS